MEWLFHNALVCCFTKLFLMVDSTEKSHKNEEVTKIKQQKHQTKR